MNKIIIVSNTSWSIFNFRLELARSIKQNGYEVTLVAPYDEYSDRLGKEFEYHDIYMNNKGTNPKEDIKTTIEFYKLYKKIKPDVVLHYTIKPNIYGTIACNMLGIRTINNIAGLGTLFVKQNFDTKIAKWLYKYSQSKADKIFFQNRDDFDMFTGENLVDKRKCDILPGSGVDTYRFTPVSYKKEDEVFRFLLVARMLWDKGIGEYVEASKIIKSKYKNIEFQMLGFLDVENNSAVSKEQMQESVGAGFVNYLGISDNVKEEIAKVDCIVLPSFYREGTPRILLESASMAKPIITTNNVGCRDVVDDGVNGYLCEIRNAQDLANKMETLLSLSESERIEMGKRGREKMILEFDESIVIGKYLITLKNLRNTL
ncbi:MAG TPA: glycosyltransferase family 1 protein [Campylobacterales bacterium]|nr:glycosyltransferase family 1 protein [Campylobacterales bacterium]